VKKGILSIVLAVLLLLPAVFTGCSGSSGGGVAQSDYDSLKTQLEAVQSQLAQAQQENLDAAAREQSDAALIAGLEQQIAGLRAQYEYEGLTTEELVARIIRIYHDTHSYQENIYDCNDMSADVWDILQKQGIGSLLAVGDIYNQITDIIQSDHAWVLAQVAPGDYLALETTGGYVVTRAENPAYYRCWVFRTPADVAAYQNLVAQYNEVVRLGESLAQEEVRVVDLYNASQNQAEADKWLAAHDELVDLMAQMQAELDWIHRQIDALVTVFY
jgi:hypothetical protein